MNEEEFKKAAEEHNEKDCELPDAKLAQEIMTKAYGMSSNHHLAQYDRKITESLKQCSKKAAERMRSTLSYSSGVVPCFVPGKMS